MGGWILIFLAVKIAEKHRYANLLETKHFGTFQRTLISGF
jgi:hypothetical protein